MKEPTGKDARLRCRLKGQQLVISIGIDVLAWAAAHSPDVERLYVWDDATGDYDESRFKVTDTAVFAKEIVHALTDEAEDGSSRLTKLIDEAVMAAIEDGCDGVEIAEDGELMGEARAPQGEEP